MKTVKQTLQALLDANNGKPEQTSLIAEDITQGEWDSLNRIEIREQHIATIIAETLVDYPSLIHSLAKMNVNRVVLGSAHGISKPVIIKRDKVATIYMNN